MLFVNISTSIYTIIKPHTVTPTMSPFEPPHVKTNKMTVRQAKTQISLGIRQA